MKLTLDVALGVLLGGLALDGVHQLQHMIFDSGHSTQAAQVSQPTTQAPAPQHQQQESIRGYPSFPQDEKPSPTETGRTERMVEEAEHNSGYPAYPK